MEADQFTSIALRVNGEEVEGRAETRTLLVDFLRDELGLTGTHVGCDTSQCGACVVHLDGVTVKSCSVLAVQAAGREVRTIEGVANPDGSLHPMQEAFREHHGLQCGFCTPGMIMTALEFAHVAGMLTSQRASEALEGNLCRCTGYQNIVKAVLAGTARMRV